MECLGKSLDHQETRNTEIKTEINGILKEIKGFLQDIYKIFCEIDRIVKETHGILKEIYEIFNRSNP